jgi:hypothetical protein
MAPTQRDPSVPRLRPDRRVPAHFPFGWCLAASALLAPHYAPAQDALRHSLAGDEAAEQRYRDAELQNYTLKTGDFKVLAVPSLEFDWNDNVNLSHTSPQQDFILKPMAQFSGSYPVTARNFLSFSVGVGYDEYLEHQNYGGVRVHSGSELAYDIYIKDLWINVHERPKYFQDPAGYASVANTATYGGLDNTAGLTTTWDLQDVVLTLGYDHENFVASSSQWEYVNHASELVLARAGFRLKPSITVGPEATGGFTSYDEQVLNNNQNYSIGAYADWRPGNYITIKPRAGYTLYDFDQTSHVIKAVNQDTWYADLTMKHEITEAVTYSLSAGHELSLGLQANSIEDWYLRPKVDLSIIKDVKLNASVSYEHGTQGGGLYGTASETFDWFFGGLGASYQLTERLSTGLDYRFTIRGSNYASREYTQNLVGIHLKYQVP